MPGLSRADPVRHAAQRPEPGPPRPEWPLLSLRHSWQAGRPAWPARRPHPMTPRTPPLRTTAPGSERAATLPVDRGSAPEAGVPPPKPCRQASRAAVPRQAQAACACRRLTWMVPRLGDRLRDARRTPARGRYSFAVRASRYPFLPAQQRRAHAALQEPSPASRAPFRGAASIRRGRRAVLVLAHLTSALHS